MISAGTLLYRQGDAGLEVLLVHPSGWYNRGRPWSIPKGLPEEGESPTDAAVRETLEETGIRPAGDLLSLGSVRYKGGKEVICFAGPAPDGATPRCASWEVDQAAFLPLSEAQTLLLEAQRPFLDKLEALLPPSP